MKKTKTTIMIFALIFGFVGTFGTQMVAADYTEAVPFGGYASGTIASSSEDWYSLYVGSGYVSLYLTGLTGDLDLAVYLWDTVAEAYVLNYTSTETGLTDESLGFLLVDYDDYVYILVTGADSDYELYGEQEYIYGYYGGWQSDYLDEYLSNFYRYEVTAEENPLYILATDFGTNDLIMNVWIQDNTGNWVIDATSDNAAGVAEELLVTGGFEGDIVIQIIAFDCGLDDYTLYNLLVQGNWIDFESNDDNIEADNLDVIGYEGWGYIFDDTDVDVFEVDVITGDVVVITLSDLDDDLDLFLFDQSDLVNPLLVSDSDYSDDEFLIFEVLSDTTLYVVVGPADEDIASLYYLSVMKLYDPEYEWGVDEGDELVYGYGTSYGDDFEVVVMMLEINGFLSDGTYDFGLVNVSYYDEMEDEFVFEGVETMFSSNLDWDSGYEAYFMAPALFYSGIWELVIVPLMDGSVNMTWMNESACILAEFMTAPEDEWSVGMEGLSLGIISGNMTMYFRWNASGVLLEYYQFEAEELNEFIILEDLLLDMTITSPADIQYNVSATGNSISWTPTGYDTFGTFYNITRNGTQVQVGEWESGTPIVVNVDGLAAGSYEYKITVFDASGKNITDTVIVNVSTPPTPPSDDGDDDGDNNDDGGIGDIPGYPLGVLIASIGVGISLAIRKRRT